MRDYLLTEDQRDCLQEITNVAMGQAGSHLARLLDVFVVLSIPHVSVLNPTDIAMALQSLNRESRNDIVHGVCQHACMHLRGACFCIALTHQRPCPRAPCACNLPSMLAHIDSMHKLNK